MRITVLIFVTLISIVFVTECKPLGDDAKLENSPCVDCEQKHVRKKRCLEELLGFIIGVPEYSRPNVYIGNGHYNTNNVVINQAHNVYIGNGRHNDNYVYYG